jgi:dienelactone hydrolase
MGKFEDGSEADSARGVLYHLLGDLPVRTGPPAARKTDEAVREHFILEKLILDLQGLEPVPAYFVKPRRQAEKYPFILFNHSHGGYYSQGKEELTDPVSTYMSRPCYAEELARSGYCALCVDAWGFGERSGKTESAIFKDMLWHGRVLWGMMVYDSIRAIDYAVTRPEVDGERIGTLGMSMGGTMAWWLAALDTRVKVCADICSLTDYRALTDEGGLDEHGIYYYVPGLLKHFTAADINALIAPRPHLGLAGNLDRLTPPAGLDRIDARLKAAYRGREGAWKLLRYDSGHIETAPMRREVLGFLERWM